MSFNTGNPVPSSDAKDLSDNAENFDSSVNLQSDTWVDRLGVTRDTVNGRLKKMGYTVPVAYAVSIVFGVNDNVKTVEEASVVYAPLPSALPFTTSGTFIGDDDARFFVVQGLTAEDLRGKRYPSNFQLIDTAINSVDTDAIYSDGTVEGSAVLNIADDGNGDGGFWDVVLLSSVTPDGEDIRALIGLGTLAIVLRSRFGAENIKGYEVFDVNFAKPFRMNSDYVATAINAFGIAQTGQSLAEGGVGGDPVSGVGSVAFAGRTLMFSGQPIGLSTQILTNIPIGLIEPARVTTGHSITKNLATGNEDTYLFSGQAWGGQPYSAIKKGGSTGVFEAVTTQVQNAKNAFDNIIYKAVTNIHGEQDGLDNNVTYAADLNEWQTDFDTDIKVITGQVEDVPMYLCQTASGGGYGFNGGITELTFPTPLEQLEAHETYPNVVLISSKYHIDYADHSHIKNISQRILGEYYAKAIAVGVSYEPLRPSVITPVGSTVVIDFIGNVGNLTLDTTLVAGITASGFSYTDDSARTIAFITVTGPAQVTVTLSGAVGTNAVIAYAYHNGAGGAANQVAGLGDRGNLRDSDTAVSSYDASPLYNWCVIFRKAVN